MDWKKILWSICKWLLKLTGKILLFCAWAISEFLAHLFTALAKYLKEKVTAKK